MPPSVAVASGMRSLPVRAHYGFAAQLGGAVLNGFDDVYIAGAAAKVARNAATNVGLGRVRIGDQQSLRDHEHAGRAEAALQSVFLPEAFLQRMQLPVLLQALDRFDVRAVGLYAEHGARFDRGSVEDHGAGAAVRRVTPDTR